MKKIIALIILSAAIFCIANETIQVRFSPKTIFAQERSQLILSGRSSTPPRFAEMPKVDGLEWLGSSNFVRSHSINGNITIVAEQAYTFVAEKEGTYTIPESWVILDGKRVKLKPITIHVKKMDLKLQGSNGEQLNLKDTVFSEFSIPGKKTIYYVGEYIPLEIKVYYLSSLKLDFSDYPRISSGKREIIFGNYQNINAENPRFDRPRYGMKQIDGKEFVYYIFRTKIKALSAGELNLKCRIPTRLNIPSERSSRMTNDPFFDSFFGSRTSYRTISHTLQAVIPTLEIKPLPPVPPGVHFLGLIGNLDLSAKFSSVKTDVGNAITLTLEISGSGEIESVQPPDLKLDGFRIYAPEVSKSGNSSQIRYTLVPIKTGTLPVSLKFCTFNAESGTYKTATITEKISVKAAKGIIPTQQVPDIVDTAIPDPQQKKQEEHSLAGIMYLKQLSEHDPAQENYFRSMIIGIIAAGILFVIICEILAYLFRGTTTAAKRRSEAKRLKKKLLVKLESSSPDEVYSLAPEISEYLNNALDLSPGTDLNESAEWIAQRNPELSQELKNISAGAWVPGAETFSEERKEKLIKMLKKLICLALFCLAPALSAAETTQKDVIKAYDAGNFKTAREWYAEKVKKDGVAPALLYNIGNCYYQEKDFVKALCCYERANLLAPRDAEIRRNLELTRRDLKLEAVNRLNTPSEIPGYIRDQMTPEEWMTLAAAGIFFLLAAFGLRRFSGLRVTLPVAIAGLLILITGAAMTISQYQTTYAVDRAIILNNGVKLRTLPTENSVFLNSEEVNEAENVRIMERRDKWIRIKAGNAIGWVPAETVGQLNGRKFSVF